MKIKVETKARKRYIRRKKQYAKWGLWYKTLCLWPLRLRGSDGITEYLCWLTPVYKRRVYFTDVWFDAYRPEYSLYIIEDSYHNKCLMALCDLADLGNQ